MQAAVKEARQRDAEMRAERMGFVQSRMGGSVVAGEVGDAVGQRGAESVL